MCYFKVLYENFISYTAILFKILMLKDSDVRILMSESFNITVTQYKSFTFNYIQNLNTRPYKSFICNKTPFFLNFRLSNFHRKEEKPLKQNNQLYQLPTDGVSGHMQPPSTYYFILHSQLGSRWVLWSFNKKINLIVFNKHKSSTNKKWIINKIRDHFNR